MMKCVECEYFGIEYWPIKAPRGYWDLGLAKCKKHDLVVDFANKRKLNRLACVEENDEE